MLPLSQHNMRVSVAACQLASLSGNNTVPGRRNRVFHLFACHCLQLTSLPDDFGKLSQMDALSLHKNSLAQLPPSLSRLRDLSRLSLYENELEEIPPGIGELNKVQEM